MNSPINVDGHFANLCTYCIALSAIDGWLCLVLLFVRCMHLLIIALKSLTIYVPRVSALL